MLKTKNKKIKITVFLLLSTMLFFSFFTSKKEESNHMYHPYPQKVEVAIKESIDFFDALDSTLNTIKDSVNNIKSELLYEQRKYQQ